MRLDIGIFKVAVRGGVRTLALAFAYSIASYREIGLIELVLAVEAIWPYIFVFVVSGLVYDLTSGSWRKSWRFTSLKDVILMAQSSTLIALGLMVAIFLLDRGAALPRSALFLTWILDIGLFGGVLLLRRAAHEDNLVDLFSPFKGRAATRKPLLLVGNLDSADSFLRDLFRESSPEYQVFGLIVPNASDVGHEVRGVRTLGDFNDLERLLAGFSDNEGASAVLLLQGAPAPADLKAEMIARMRKRGMRLLRRNSVTDFDAPLRPLSLRELDFNELLARPPVHLDHERVRRLVSGKRVLVTGAGGSIGSEICRQVAALSCSHLVLLDNSEFSLFKIDQEIADAFPTMSRAARLCDVRDGRRVREFLAAEAPEIVFHAAALKHVPLMEAHPADSALTNIIGSANVADAAIASGARNFVFISTDKAVNPPNVMGATKRLAERAVCQRRRPGGPRFNVVRFGNVLGSAGSVVPTFLTQIERGGPVTLTHPDIERYFMTIPEAVQLVLHATAKSAFDDVEGVLVLDMGKPVKIIELARRLIELHGKLPGTDIEIKVTGLRPGEKMTEALFDETETARQCEPGVLEVIDNNSDVRLTEANLQRLERAARAGQDEEVRAMIFEMLAAVRLPREGRGRSLKLVD
jgi:O-antigen biosynthesis protein WbqV